jgi:hypothetical protein
MEEICSPKSPLTLTGLYRIVFQKTELFIVTAVRASYPTNRLLAESQGGWHTTLQTVRFRQVRAEECFKQNL